MLLGAACRGWGWCIAATGRASLLGAEFASSPQHTCVPLPPGQLSSPAHARACLHRSRRAAMAQEQGAAEEAAADRRTAGDAMDTDEGGVRMPILPAEAPALAAPKSPRPQVPFAPPPAFELC